LQHAKQRNQIGIHVNIGSAAAQRNDALHRSFGTDVAAV
jgi:hypothetical protein